MSTAIGWVKRWRTTGSVAAKPMGGDQSSRIRGEDARWVLALVRSRPDMALAEIAEELRQQRGLEVSVSVIWRFLDKRELRVKKTLHAAEQERPDVAAARAAWRDAQPLMDADRLVLSTRPGPRPL